MSTIFFFLGGGGVKKKKKHAMWRHRRISKCRETFSSSSTSIEMDDVDFELSIEFASFSAENWIPFDSRERSEQGERKIKASLRIPWE